MRRLGPMRGPNARARASWSARARSSTVRTPSSARRAAVRSPTPQMAVTGRAPIVGIHSARLRRATPRGLAAPGGGLRQQAGLADADRAVQPGALEHGRLHRAGQRLGIVGLGTDERLVPPPHLDDDRERTQRGHHLRRRGVVGGVVGRQEHGRRAPSERLRSAPSPSARRGRGPRRRRWPPPGAGDGGCRRHRRRPAGRPAPGRRSTSTAARNWSRSTCRIQPGTAGTVAHRGPPRRRPARAAALRVLPVGAAGGHRRRRPLRADRRVRRAAGDELPRPWAVPRRVRRRRRVGRHGRQLLRRRRAVGSALGAADRSHRPPSPGRGRRRDRRGHDGVLRRRLGDPGPGRRGVDEHRGRPVRQRPRRVRRRRRRRRSSSGRRS